uniref:glutathione transferase n=1 Tax=Spermophilus dauricus TaxID=99837 RepID=A0A8C9QHP4_SPEDA
MAGKPILHYFDGRGRMENIRWLLAAAVTTFDSVCFLLPQDGSLMFQQVPMVEIDGMKLVQTRAILNYIAAKHNLYGKDIKERALIDMYSEGMTDLNEMVLLYPYLPSSDKGGRLTQIKEKSRNRYFPAFEKAPSNSIGITTYEFGGLRYSFHNRSRRKTVGPSCILI